MTGATTRPRSADNAARLLAGLAVGLAVAFVLAPARLAARGSTGDFADESDLRTAFRAAFADYWRSGKRDLNPALQQIVDYWFRYHLVKAVVAAILLAVLARLALLLWRSFLAAAPDTGGTTALAAGATVTTLLSLFSTVLLMANIQGMIAPFASLLPMLTSGPSDPETATVRAQITQYLTDYPANGTPPALDVMISDFARYHVAMAIIAATVAIAFIAVSILLWKRYAATDYTARRPRRLLAVSAILSALLSLTALVVVYANVTSAADSPPALAALFAGSW
ncbi:hypothetical protein [Nocardia yamanashiensis]|uniref:hypothetical protein n=1 Tax=Nocardia yamanashiensis TaxID=209247 RepID=UPI000ACAAFF4|nr:hypothetical protein [Nocardia yamanashiensis]